MRLKKLIINQFSFLLESIEAEYTRGLKTNKPKEGLKDNIVTCEHCTKVFGCTKCTSKISFIRRLKNALDMKEQTIESEYVYI